MTRAEKMMMVVELISTNESAKKFFEENASMVNNKDDMDTFLDLVILASKLQ